MPQLKDWLNALMSDCTITVVSSTGLINEVQRKQFARAQGLARQGKPVPPMKSRLATVPVFDPSRTIHIRPISLLHAVGRITTPPIPNPADLSSKEGDPLRRVLSISLPRGWPKVRVVPSWRSRPGQLQDAALRLRHLPVPEPARRGQPLL